jgi:PilZ domain
MAKNELESEFARMVEQIRLRGEVEAERADRERRRGTRLLPEAPQIRVGDDPWVYLINLSRDGLAFFSDVRYAVGDIVPVSVEGGATVQARVVECCPDVEDPGAVAGQLRVSCAFTDPQAGLRFFFSLKSLEAAHLEAGQS